ncbi:hypothetical protein BDV95DRAFT_210377 [Massariosphaeria phaeospora]|uniref:Uncharacterized protein n=1 Tax=Massariosphaeria phaeospora TaxID=100035 RepID=A0A7C8MD62_9PLEO|nr:hypothetical protein BDV95DRAFT_210377 [Massariosphaeria phaeospora]
MGLLHKSGHRSRTLVFDILNQAEGSRRVFVVVMMNCLGATLPLCILVLHPLLVQGLGGPFSVRLLGMACGCGALRGLLLDLVRRLRRGRRVGCGRRLLGRGWQWDGHVERDPGCWGQQ